MNVWDLLILALVALLIAGAVRTILKKPAGCGGNCCSCSGHCRSGMEK